MVRMETRKTKVDGGRIDEMGEKAYGGAILVCYNRGEILRDESMIS